MIFLCGNATSLGGKSPSCVGILLQVGEHNFLSGNKNTFGEKTPFFEGTYLYAGEIHLFLWEFLLLWNHLIFMLGKITFP